MTETERELDLRLGEALAEIRRLAAVNAELLEALEEIAADYEDRFDMDSPGTNPGIKQTHRQARASIAKHHK